MMGSMILWVWEVIPQTLGMSWGDIKPVTHYSESRRDEQKDETIRVQAHSDYVYDKIEMYGNDFDIMVEAKAKELAVDRYLKIHG